MKERIKNYIRCISYLVLIMLLLLSSLPLSGVFAEVSECEDELKAEEDVREDKAESADKVREAESEYVENTSEEETENIQKEKSQIQLQARIEKEGHFSYREDYGRSVLLSFFVEEFQSDADIYVVLTSTNEAVIKPKKEQERYAVSEGYIACEVTGAGEAELILRLMENDSYEAQEFRISIIVMNSTMEEKDFAILYTPYEAEEVMAFQSFQEWEELLTRQNNWLNGTIYMELTDAGSKYYETIDMQKEYAQELWQGRQYYISEESIIQTYEFWCSHSQTNASTKEAENGKKAFRVGIDRTAPRQSEFSYSQDAYEATSTETTKYYSEDFVISGAFEDSLSGIVQIEYTTQADFGEAAKWEIVRNTGQDGAKTTYELALGQGIYTGVAVRAVDAAGNVSEAVELKNKRGDFLCIIVDKTEPILDIMLKTQDEKVYTGQWTNQAVRIAVEESRENQTLSGIQSIQYQYVSIGGDYQPEQWTELQPEEEIVIGDKAEIKINQNGIYYIRAISNTGIMTDIETQKDTAVRIRLQQTLPEKKEILEKGAQLEEGREWYNRKTGVPALSFAYPKYDNGVKSQEYGAPITAHTRLTRFFSGEKEGEIIDKSATIGVHSDEQYRQLIQIENDNNEQSKEEYLRKYIEESLDALNINFSYDSQTGYAQDGIYELDYWITDAAGNESEHAIYTYKIDTHEPQNLEIILDGARMREGTSHTIQYDRFYQASVSGSASADFGVSGKKYIKVMLSEETDFSENDMKWRESDNFVINPCSRGCIYMLAEDMAGNQSILRTQGVIVDNQAPMGEYGGKFIKIVTNANENKFYNDDVSIHLGAGDFPQNSGYSGIEAFSCVIGTAEKEQRKELFSFTKGLPDKEEIAAAKSYSTSEIINAVSCEGNDTYIEITVKDRCGNVSTSREEIKIDITAPQVEITFDWNEAKNGSYYNRGRTATIHIQELNFNRNGINIEVTRDGAVYPVSVSEWRSEGINHWASIAFTEDGDYTMSVTCTDLADNASEMVSIEPFTVDATKPEIEITYDNHDAKNEIYYQTARTATISIKEHNFREEDFILMTEPQAATGEWRHTDDEHSIQVYFSEDNHYRLGCSVADMAGNEADMPEEQEFYIDSVAPQIVIRGVEDGSANAGEISPVVIVYDMNRNIEGTNIVVTTGLGERVPVSVQMQDVEEGYSYLLTDMSVKEDDIYFLEVTALDMAGNESTLIYRFSLNRNGSAYDLSGIAQIMKKVYNRFEELPDICFMEMNVNEIEEYAFYITRNGKMLSCIEETEALQVDYGEDKVCYYVEKEVDENKGYTNRYVFGRENFEKEGIYRITCYSKDAAGNEMNNTLEEKHAEISFVIDNTVPKVVVNGIKEGGIYNEEELKVNIMVQDNFLLSKAVFRLLTESGDTLQSWDYMESVQNVGDVMTITIPSREEKQFLCYEVSDAAQNELVLLPDGEEAPKGILVTTNPWLRFIGSPVKVAVAVIVIVVIIIISFLWLFFMI